MDPAPLPEHMKVFKALVQTMLVKSTKCNAERAHRAKVKGEQEKTTECCFLEAKSAECEQSKPKTCKGAAMRHTNGQGKQTTSRTIFAKRQKKEDSFFNESLVAEMGFEPHDLRVMSPTSYQAALPRDIQFVWEGREMWCRKPGSNRYEKQSHGILSPGRLPIPPFRHTNDLCLPHCYTIITP